MLDYVIFSVVIDFLVLTCMISMINKNKVLDQRQRIGFITSFVLILIVSIIELFSLAIDDIWVDLKYLNLVLINTYLIIAPIIPVLYAGALSSYKHKSFKYILSLYLIYVLFIFIAIPLKLIFYIDSNKNYIRASFYPVFIAFYVLFKLYLVYMAYMKIKRFDNPNWFSLLALLLAFIWGSSIQLYDSTIHTVWSCLTLILIVYYAYYNELCRQLDEMTDMYSHQVYLSRSTNIKKGESLIIMDCDKFKELNDTYGHAEGDKCLIKVASIIKKVFSKSGVCYRIGGDEFAVILFKDKDVEALISEFASLIKEAREENPILPNISVGYSTYDGSVDIQRFKDQADQEMYTHKQSKKVIESKD